jgi:prepilin-type processing-associated H-X9-DG protein/prepilin-type N-terminal cleavage/methylation domain-containing protein
MFWLKNQGRRKRMAFTLVELLVVIAIIVILAALAFPITTSMIERGNTTKCVNNLRQIGGGIGRYMIDNDGYIPCSSGPDFSGSGNTLGFSHHSAPIPCIINVGSNLPSSFTNRTDYDKATAKHPFNCPSCKTAFRTYTANKQAMGFLPSGNAFRQRKTTYFTNLPKLVLIADDTAGDPSPNNSGADQFDETDYLTKIGQRHNGKANILFADFHIECLSRTNLITANNIKQQ